MESAYSRNQCIETVVTKVCNDLIFQKRQGKDAILVMLDLSASFDTVDPDILLDDFFALGIDSIVLEWFRTYLKNRKLRVCANDNLSDECLMKVGFPHGTISVFLLFIILKIELHYVLESLGYS